MNPTNTEIAGPTVTHLSRQQILEVTSRCLREHGYDATTIRRIAGMLGCAVGSIYRYYDDKRELLLEVTQRLLDPVVQHLDGGGAWEQSVSVYAQRAASQNEAYRLMFWLACRGPAAGGERHEQLPPIVREIIARWATALSDELLARQVWATVHGSVIAGLDEAATLATVKALISRSAQPEVSVIAGTLPGAVPQIVTLPVTPRVPESATRAASRRESGQGEPPGREDESRRREHQPHDEAEQRTDDVCLL